VAVTAKKGAARKTSTTKSSATEKGTDTNIPGKEALLHYYQEMLKIRRFEEKAGQLYGMGLIGGFCHLYIGQEAVVVGITAASAPQDTTITGYRDHGHMLACQMDPKGVMAELTGRETGYSRGKGGSMHMFSREKNFFGGHGIVGAQISIGTGLGFAHQYKKDKGVCIAYMGDGAVNQGQVAESFNMAGLWKLPVVYVVENNQYGMGTSVVRASATTELYRRSEAFGFPGKRVDGMRVWEVEKAAKEALDHARSGKGPVLLEMMTYRYRGHSMSDPANYRTKEELNEYKTSQDPIELVKKELVNRHKVDESELKAMDKDIRAVVNEAAKFAQDSPEPDPQELWTDVLKSA